MGRIDDLHRLAFDTAFPATLTGDVAKRVIRLNRLRTALGAAARARRHDAIVDMLVELSTVVAVDERGQDYLLAHPDLVVALGDSDALRRLFESKTAWAGSRHARLTTAYTTDGDLPEAFVHGKRTEEWIQWLWKQDKRDRFDVKTEVEDYVGIASYLVASGRTTVAASYIDQWRSDAYSYRLATRLVEVCSVSQALGKMPKAVGLLGTAADCRRLPASIPAAVLKSLVVDDIVAGKLLSRLTKAVAKRPGTGDDLPEYREVDSYHSGPPALRSSRGATATARGAHAGDLRRSTSASAFGVFGIRSLHDMRFLGSSRWRHMPRQRLGCRLSSIVFRQSCGCW